MLLFLGCTILLGADGCPILLVVMIFLACRAGGCDKGCGLVSVAVDDTCQRSIL